MYKIQRKANIFFLTLSGTINGVEMRNWLNESKMHLADAPTSFNVIVDIRELKPLTGEARELMIAAQKYFREKGMERSSVIISNRATLMQFRRTAQESGIGGIERYIDASKNPNWARSAIAWAHEGKDPDN